VVKAFDLLVGYHESGGARREVIIFGALLQKSDDYLLVLSAYKGVP
jgi:hypothetical protein